ncbi:hypothetical protein [Listeria ivanovii]|uniref:hypothetical protein n=1 Tax=Listeria ivanovii TaxID=1638 RepID=UPI00051273E1|nr:hypothetical protein [Listeria ivanovii]AIS63317.1 hypothetical protein JL53_11565 [Listeria ivanovii subsp. londoniensis]MBC2255883.1 hypothetical protein [Listeria ivanovii]MBK1966384.1 hypothetical protein [Listeria ivanovii subsp. londoniensis]MBK1983593.1 hypothetical protein [Listeria ivanovii subsp. londoniensis]MBK1995191.1 hypothetical protein [Listeria ivanovii subsp. londoniensis]
MKKKWLILILSVIILCALVFGVKWLLFRDNLVEMMQVEDVLYIVTYEPAKKEDALEKIGEVEHRIRHYRIPDENFTSNYLSEGTELYKAKNGNEFPKTILFKENGEYFIASEAMEQPNKKR